MTATCMYLCGAGSLWVYPWPFSYDIWQAACVVLSDKFK